MTRILVALAAGVAAALMFASLASGALISLLLFYLSPLPLMMAALGWGAGVAGLGGLAAGLVLGGIFNVSYMGAFLMSVALPAWWLGRIVLLGRAGEHDATHVEWYPLGRALAWIAAFAAATTLAALLTLGLDAETITASLRRGLSRMIDMQGLSAGYIAMLGVLAPAAAATVAVTTLTFNLWLAARITRTSGRLPRPWPDFSATALPPMTLVVLLVALAFCFVGGLVAMAAQTAAAALFVAYALVGLATLHVLTLGRRHRTIILMTTYAALMVFGWPAIALIALGIADALFALRARHPPPRPA